GYQNDLFLGDIHAGQIFHFSLDQDRTELLLPVPLNDKIADTDAESASEAIIFATGFAGISDIEVSPYDGYMYVVSLGQGKIFKVLPTADLDMSASAGSVPSPPPTPPTPPDTTLPPEGDEADENNNGDNNEPSPEDESSGDGDGSDDENGGSSNSDDSEE
ncbi:MAG: hypothetical protein ACRD8W_08230, partial [Nitrososphaeraceae archaeon]